MNGETWLDCVVSIAFGVAAIAFLIAFFAASVKRDRFCRAVCYRRAKEKCPHGLQTDGIPTVFLDEYDGHDSVGADSGK